MTKKRRDKLRKQIKEQPITLRVDVIEGEDIRRDGVAQEWMQWLEKVQLREFQHEDLEWSRAGKIYL